MTDLPLTIKTAAAALRDGQITSVELTTGMLDRIERLNPRLGASFTGMWNLIGLPALAMPCGFSSTELPLSMQIVGKPFDETSVLRVADAFQQLTDWHLQVPPIATRTLEPVGVQ